MFLQVSATHCSQVKHYRYARLVQIKTVTAMSTIPIEAKSKQTDVFHVTTQL